MASLIVFHRVLIGFGIAFCLGYAGWELSLWWVSRSGAALAVGLVFLGLAAGLTFYLAHLRRFLGQDEGAHTEG